MPVCAHVRYCRQAVVTRSGASGHAALGLATHDVSLATFLGARDGGFRWCQDGHCANKLKV